MESLTISDFSINEADQVAGLIKTVFDEFIAPGYSEEGNAFFYRFINPEQIIDRFYQKNMQLTAKIGGEIVGFLEIRDSFHICLLFVDKRFHRKGIAKKLLVRSLEKYRGTNEGLSFLEVNASPFSENIYKKLGFTPIDGLQEMNGMKFVPMRMNA